MVRSTLRQGPKSGKIRVQPYAPPLPKQEYIAYISPTRLQSQPAKNDTLCAEWED